MVSVAPRASGTGRGRAAPAAGSSCHHDDQWHSFLRPRPSPLTFLTLHLPLLHEAPINPHLSLTSSTPHSPILLFEPFLRRSGSGFRITLAQGNTNILATPSRHLQIYNKQNTPANPNILVFLYSSGLRTSSESIKFRFMV